MYLRRSPTAVGPRSVYRSPNDRPTLPLSSLSLRFRGPTSFLARCLLILAVQRESQRPVVSSTRNKIRPVAKSQTLSNPANNPKVFTFKFPLLPATLFSFDQFICSLISYPFTYPISLVSEFYVSAVTFPYLLFETPLDREAPKRYTQGCA